MGSSDLQDPAAARLQNLYTVGVPAMCVFVVRHATLNTMGIREANTGVDILQRPAKHDFWRIVCITQLDEINLKARNNMILVSLDLIYDI
jgi:hypothetical protein